VPTSSVGQVETSAKRLFLRPQRRGETFGKRLRDDVINLELVGGFNPFEKILVKMGIFPR